MRAAGEPDVSPHRFIGELYKAIAWTASHTMQANLTADEPSDLVRRWSGPLMPSHNMLLHTSYFILRNFMNQEASPSAWRGTRGICILGNCARDRGILGF